MISLARSRRSLSVDAFGFLVIISTGFECLEWNATLQSAVDSRCNRMIARSASRIFSREVYMKIISLCFMVLSLWMGLAQQTWAAAADDKAVADFYRGKTVKIIVGFSAGGGY